MAGENTDQVATAEAPVTTTEAVVETPSTLNLSDVSARLGAEFKSPDDLYGFLDSRVSEADRKFKEAEQLQQGWNNIPAPIKHYHRIQQENPTLSHDEIIDRYVSDLQASRTNYVSLAEQNPEEVLVRGIMQENPYLTRKDAERRLASVKAEIENGYPEDEHRDELVLRAKGYIKPLESAKPKFETPAPDPQAIQAEVQAREAFKHNLKAVAQMPYEIDLGGTKVKVNDSPNMSMIIDNALKSEDPAMALIEHIVSRMYDPNTRQYLPERAIAVLRAVETGPDAFKAIYDRSLSEATLRKEAAVSNAGGQGGNAVAATGGASIGDVYSWAK